MTKSSSFLLIACCILADVRGGLPSRRNSANNTDYRSSCTTNGRPDFYWRQYEDYIPQDALIGGYDDDGYHIYVGQVLYGPTFALIPANIFVGKKGALSSVETRSYTYEIDVKILCASDRNEFRWVPTTTDKFEDINYYLVPGGTEIQKLVHIGRTKFEDRLIVGKIFGKKEPNRGMWIPTKAGGTTRVNDFEILVYDPKRN